jgi:hypothetical protein
MQGLPSKTTIQRWKKKFMPEAMVIPSKLIQEKLKGVDYKVDVLKHLS